MTTKRADDDKTTDADPRDVELAQLRAQLAAATAPDPEPAEQAPDPLLGRLVLDTGTIVAVPAEGCQLATHHYDESIGATVGVRSAFILSA